MRSDQRAAIFAALNRLGWMAQKQALAYSFSNQRSESTKDLTDAEATQLLAHLRAEESKKKGFAPVTDVDKAVKRERSNQMRKKIFSLCRDMGYIYGFKKEDNVINQAVVYGLVRRKGYLKPLDLMKYRFDQLPKLVSQFESMAANNDKTKAKKEAAELKKEMGF